MPAGQLRILGQGAHDVEIARLLESFTGEAGKLSSRLDRGDALAAHRGRRAPDRPLDAVDDAQGRFLAFDNMEQRPLRGTFDWMDVSVVLAVPPEAAMIAGGVLLDGPGAVRATRVRLEPAGDDVPVTGYSWLGGWALAGSRAHAYEFRIVPSDREQGGRMAVLRSTADPGVGHGTLAQWLRIDDPPRRLRLRAALRGEAGGADAHAVLWLRADSAGNEPLALVNAPRPPLTGAFGWRPVEALFDVPDGTRALGFGLVLAGPGTLCVADLALEGEAEDGRWTPLPDARDLTFE